MRDEGEEDACCSDDGIVGDDDEDNRVLVADDEVVVTSDAAESLNRGTDERVTGRDVVPDDALTEIRRNKNKGMMSMMSDVPRCNISFRRKRTGDEEGS